MNNDWSDEKTDNPLRAEDRNFYKVEKWTKDGAKIDRMLYAGNNLEKAQEECGLSSLRACVAELVQQLRDVGDDVPSLVLGQ